MQQLVLIRVWTRFLSTVASLATLGVVLSTPNGIIAGAVAQTANQPSNQTPRAKNATLNTAEALIDRSTAAMRVDPEASRVAAEAALEVLKRKPNPDLEIRARLLLCDYQSERDRRLAEQQIEFAIALLPQATRAGLHAGILTCQGEILETTADNAKALGFYEQAVAIATETKDNEMLAGALFSRGYLVGLQGNFANGLSDLRHAQDLYEKVKLPFHALTALNSIAILYNRMGDYTQALYIYDRALKAQRDSGMRREQAVTLHNAGRAHENLQHWELAREAFAQSLAICRELNYTRGEAYALRGIASAANELGDPQTALSTLDLATTLQKQIPDARLSAQINLVRGRALHRLGRLPQSMVALDQALKIFAKAEAAVELSGTYNELAKVNAAQGHWRAAYEMQALSQSTSDQLFRNQLDQRFITLKVEFDTAAKEKENAALVRENEANQKALEQDHRAQRLQGVVIGLSTFLILLLIALAFRQRRSAVRMRKLAMTDELTGVPNRRSVLRKLEPTLQRSDELACAMLAIDIDHFKSINDRHGHPAGDEALKLIAATIAAETKEPAYVGRLGGEEFIVVVPDATLAVAQATAEHLRQRVMAIDSSRWTEERRITVSIGITLSVPGDTTSSMLRRADAALYAAKQTGRNCWTVELAQPIRSDAPTP